MPKQRADVIAYLMLGLGVTAIGCAPILTKLSMQVGAIGPSAAGFWRMGLAAAVYWFLRGVQVARSQSAGQLSSRSGDVHASASQGAGDRSPVVHMSGSRRWLLLSLPGLFFAFDLYTWHKAFELTSLANASLLANLAPLCTAVIGWLWLGERYDWRFGLGVALAFAGMALLVLSSAGVRSGTSSVAGDLLATSTAVFYTAYLVTMKRLRSRFGTFELMSAHSTAAAIVLLALALAGNEPLIPATTAGWGYTIALSGVSHMLGQGSLIYALARVPVGFSSLFLLLQPVLTAVLAWSVLGQPIAALQGLGGMVVLTGIALAVRGKRG